MLQKIVGYRNKSRIYFKEKTDQMDLQIHHSSYAYSRCIETYTAHVAELL